MRRCAGSGSSTGSDVAGSSSLDDRFRRRWRWRCIESWSWLGRFFVHPCRWRLLGLTASVALLNGRFCPRCDFLEPTSSCHGSGSGSAPARLRHPLRERRRVAAVRRSPSVCRSAAAARSDRLRFEAAPAAARQWVRGRASGFGVQVLGSATDVRVGQWRWARVRAPREDLLLQRARVQVRPRRPVRALALACRVQAPVPRLAAASRRSTRLTDLARARARSVSAQARASARTLVRHAFAGGRFLEAPP